MLLPLSHAAALELSALYDDDDGADDDATADDDADDGADDVL